MAGKQRRIITNPTSVEVTDRRPNFVRNRYNQRQAAGIHYERKCAEWFAAKFGEDAVRYGLWLKYLDENGNGWCQPDLLLLPPHLDQTVWVGECKLKSSKAAEERLRNMYVPLAYLLYPDHTIIGVQFCRHLSSTKNMKNQRNLIGYEELLDMTDYDKDFYTVNLRRVY